MIIADPKNYCISWGFPEEKLNKVWDCSGSLDTSKSQATCSASLQRY